MCMCKRRDSIFQLGLCIALPETYEETCKEMESVWVRVRLRVRVIDGKCVGVIKRIRQCNN